MKSPLLLARGTKTNDIRKTNELIKCKKQHKSLKRLLTKVKLYKTTLKAMVKKCGCSNYGCSHNSDFLFKSEQRLTFKISFKCVAENLIYEIICSDVGKIYWLTNMTKRGRTTLRKEQIWFQLNRQIPLSWEMCR